MFGSILGGLIIVGFAVGFVYTAFIILHETYKKPIFKYAFMAMITLLPIIGIIGYWVIYKKKKDWII
ncbi:MAG TPA: hypothetical protein PK252_00775 [Bacteroidales bacterium]|nr:hypothetical protein [Bacteroidales bacterium]